MVYYAAYETDIRAIDAIIAVALAAAAPAVSVDEVPWNTYVVDRTVEVSPGARKNKAFPMAEGSALCDLHLMAKAPWRIRSSRIALLDDKTLWVKASDREYIIAGGYAPNEYVVVRGELEKPGGGKNLPFLRDAPYGAYLPFSFFLSLTISIVFSFRLLSPSRQSGFSIWLTTL